MPPAASSSKSMSPEPLVVDKKERKRKRKEKEAAEAAAVAEEVVVEEEEDAPAKDEGANSDADEEEKSDADPDVPVVSHAERRRQKKEAKLAAKLKAETDTAEGTAAEGAPVKKRKLGDGSAKTVEPSKRQNSVWVGNMSFKTQQEDLRRFFNDVPGITRVNMPMKAPSGPGKKPENRGFAYVDFATAEAKTAAIALSENPLLGRKLLIKDGESFEGRPAATSGGELNLSDPTLVQKTHSKTAQKMLKSQKQPPAATLFMGNLGFETTDESIRQLLNAHKPGNKKGKNVSKPVNEEKEKDEEKDDDEKDLEKAAPVEVPAPKDAPEDDWIRQVRMGTFEDSGMCKGFAFIDFTSVDHATAVLINPKNHHLNGRNLLVEYASPDAVRRGMYKVRPPGERVANQGKKRPHRTERLQARAAARGEGVPADGEAAEGDDEGGEAAERPKRPWEHKDAPVGEGARHKGPRSRPKPGAALAMAKRENVSIVPSEGKKVVF